MTKLSLNSIPSKYFMVNSADRERGDIVSMGRVLMTEHARRGVKAMNGALKRADMSGEPMISGNDYKEFNEKFQAEHLLYAAKLACDATGTVAPESYEDFKRNSLRFYKNERFFAVLQGIYEEILTPILPRVYSEAVSVFADVVPVGFGQTYQLTVTSNDIVVFQDSSWGASRSVPTNTLYAKDYTLNPSPKTAQLKFKWHQLISNDMDFGRFFANLTAGLYAKTMGMFSEAMVNAASDTTLIPSGLTYNFSNTNWVTLANKISAVNNVGYGNLIAYGGAVALSKVLPTAVTGSTNVNMDAAIATLLGADYISSGYLGEFMGVRLMPLTDAVVPGTQNGNVTTILPTDKIWMMASSGRKPLTIAMNDETPITIEFDPEKSGDFMIGANITVSLEIASIFSSRIGLVSI